MLLMVSSSRWEESLRSYARRLEIMMMGSVSGFLGGALGLLHCGRRLVEGRGDRGPADAERSMKATP